MALAILLIAIVVAVVLFNLLSPWWLTPLASNWDQIDNTLNITMAITGAFFVAINLFVAYCIIRFRKNAKKRADHKPDNKKLEWWLTGLTSVGIAAMLAPGLLVYADLIHPPLQAAIVEVVGQQWGWSFRYPGRDGLLGVSDTRFISGDNPFGLNPTDPHGRDDILVQTPELHLPVGRPVVLLLRSKDVLHDFYVPQFRARMNLVPGMETRFWLTPTKPGRYEILCAQLCGVGHYNMRGAVVVESPEAFHAWLSKQQTFAQAAANTLAAGQGNSSAEQGRALAASKGCVACHSPTGGVGIGPTWKDLYGSTVPLSDGKTVTADEAYLRESIVAPSAKIVQGYAPVMPKVPLDTAQLAALVAYIESLSSKAPAGAQKQQTGQGG